MRLFISKYARWRNVLILLGLVVIINILLGLSLQGNPNLKPLDLQFSYSPEKANELISAYSDKERSLYLLIEVTLDIAYPIIYSLCLSFALFLLYNNMRLAKLPLFLILLELFENAGIVILLANYPHQHPWVASVASVFTSLKWTLAVLCLLLVLAGFVRLALKRS
jgi:hypothetical protein